jgi:hypothetical protein
MATHQGILQPTFKVALEGHANLDMRLSDLPSGPLERQQKGGAVPPGGLMVLANAEIGAGGSTGGRLVGTTANLPAGPIRIGLPEHGLGDNWEPLQVRRSGNLSGTYARLVEKLAIERDLSISSRHYLRQHPVPPALKKLSRPPLNLLQPLQPRHHGMPEETVTKRQQGISQQPSFHV